MENCYAEIDSISVTIKGNGNPHNGTQQSALIYAGGAVGCGYASKLSHLVAKGTVTITNAVRSIYADCCYIAAEPTEGAHGNAITDAADKNAYKNFDFENKWTVSGGKAMPLNVTPSVCAANSTAENGEAISLDSVVVSQPSNVKKIAVVTTNTFNKQSSVKTYDIGEISESEKFFKTVDIGYDIPVFCKVTAVAITDGVASRQGSISDGEFHAVLTNGVFF